jgi:hypothetical protein
LQSLLLWDRIGKRVDPKCIEAGANYLAQHLRDEYLPPLWIGKCLYTPHNVVRAAAIGALYSYLQYHEN